MRLSKSFLFVLLLLAVAAASGCSLITQGGAADADITPEEAGGTVIIESVTVPSDEPGAFHFTGVPTGTIAAGSTLVVSDLEAGAYTTTQVDPAPDFDVTAVSCDDGGSANPSSGDPQSRTAVLNIDPGETVRCTFTNTRRGSVVVVGQTEPDAVGGAFQFTGVPSGTISSNGSLVVADLAPGTYSTTERDPAPEFDLTAVECDDGGSASPSNADPQSRTAIFNLDPGEIVTCAFTNTRRGTVVVASQVVPEGTSASFRFTGVPSGTIAGAGTLVAANLSPGSYTTTKVDQAPDFELTTVECDDGGSARPSSGDPQTRTAVFNIDAGETVTCLFTTQARTTVLSPTVTSGSGATNGGNVTSGPGAGTNPFENPGQYLSNFPLPAEIPPGAGTFAAPKPGTWSVTNFAGQMSCGDFSLTIPSSPPESGVLEVLDGGQTLIGTGLQDAQGASITLTANPDVNGLYSGAVQGIEQGVPVTINFFWLVVTDEYIVGYLTANVTAEGVSCDVYRSFEMIYTG